MPRILIIDDDEKVRATAKIILDARGFESVLADGGKAGVEAFKASAFDLVLVDLFMPGMDGLETTKVLRQHNPKIPVIAMSGFMFGGRDSPVMPNFEPMAEEAGATETLYKPFRPDELVRVIRKVLAVAA